MPRGNTGLRAADPDLERALRDMPPEEVRCRGAHHRFARDTVLPGQQWPDSVRAWPDGDGRIRIEDPCIDCGMVWRVTKTGYDGQLDAFAKPYLSYAEDWVRIPQGLDRRKRTVRAEGYRRGRAKDSASLQRALDRTAEREAQPHVPAVRFSGRTA